MKKDQIKGRANAILALSGVGILAAFPFQHTLAGGLLFAGFSAATIGGLADSFAIGALFGNPLRIKWPRWMGTHIISRNRARLIGELADMVEKELLTVDNIRETLRDHHLADAVVRYLTEHGGADDVKSIASKLAAELLGKMDTGRLASNIHQFLMDHADALQASDMLADIADWSVRNGYDEQIVTYMAKQFAKLAGTEQFRQLVEQLAESALRSYEGDKFRRRLVDFTAGLNAYAISVKAQVWIVGFLEGYADEAHPQRERLKETIGEFVRRLREDGELRERVEQAKLKLLEAARANLRLDEFLERNFMRLRDRLLAGQAGDRQPPREGADESGSGQPPREGADESGSGQPPREGTDESGSGQLPREGTDESGSGQLPRKGADEDGGEPPPQWIAEQIDTAIARLAGSAELRASMDGGIKSLLLSWLEQHHAVIGSIVRDKLNSFSEEELIGLVKEKAGKDLQYIRLNGMIVGALVGIVLFLSTFWIGGAR